MMLRRHISCSTAPSSSSLSTAVVVLASSTGTGCSDSNSNNNFRRSFSAFAINMETAQPATGPPRGLLNRMASLGLPPWAAWTRKLDGHAMYRLTGVNNGAFLPKYPEQMETIWGNERVRERVTSTREKQYCRRELKYPYVRTGVWFSDALDHWVQLPHVKGAQYDIEREGGFDNYVLKRDGPELKSTYGERVRRHILARQREIEKNFTLQQHAEKLADQILSEASSDEVSGDQEALEKLLQKYGIDKGDVVTQAEQVRLQLQGAMN